MTDRCSATSKATGERCKRLVVGGGPCPLHGGAAPQVRARREARVLVGEAALAGPVVPRDPGEALWSAVQDADHIVSRLKGDLTATGRIEPSELMALGEWLDRVGRLSKVVLDARIGERLARLSEEQGQLVADVIHRVLGRLELTAEQQRADRLIPRFRVGHETGSMRSRPP